jgi:DNA-binding winged helix-turn-helix (wHTH) protein/TolB-like protein
MSSTSPDRVYGFGPFRYDPVQRLLFRDGTLVSLVPKAIDTLHVLLENRGRIVDKAELMRLVWPDTTVEEVGLARNISLLRKALEEEEGGSQYIETIPRRGYRFIGEVSCVEPELAMPQPRQPGRMRWAWALGALTLAAAAAAVWWQFYVPSQYLKHRPGAAGTAVVPFRCLTPGRECAAFSEGLDEVLATELSKLDWLQVVSPSTVRRHQRVNVSMGAMGRLLGLDALVEGSVQQLGGQIRITANLVDVHTGKLIWGEDYDFAAAEAARAQSEAARRITASVGAHLAIQGRFSPPIH